MRNLIWRLLADLVTTPRVFGFLKWLALKRPMGHLPGYMNRWWLIPYSWPLPFAVRLHNILRRDLDDALHDHPWNWRTIILRGWYIEEDAFGAIDARIPGDTSYRFAHEFHRIAAISSEELWTLFITYKWRNRWGFMTGEPPRKVYYREYESPNGRTDKPEPVT